MTINFFFLNSQNNWVGGKKKEKKKTSHQEEILAKIQVEGIRKPRNKKKGHNTTCGFKFPIERIPPPVGFEPATLWSNPECSLLDYWTFLNRTMSDRNMLNLSDKLLYIYWLKEETIHTFYTDILDNKQLPTFINMQN